MPGIPGVAMTAAGALLLMETTRDRCVGRAKEGTDHAPFQIPNAKCKVVRMGGERSNCCPRSDCCCERDKTGDDHATAVGSITGVPAQFDTQDLPPTSNSKALGMECNLDLLQRKCPTLWSLLA